MRNPYLQRLEECGARLGKACTIASRARGGEDKAHGNSADTGSSAAYHQCRAS